MEVTDSGKRVSLLQQGINHGRKGFIVKANCLNLEKEKIKNDKIK